jgi:hypothetical protein
MGDLMAELPIIGEAPRHAMGAIMEIHVTALEQLLHTHKVAIQIIQGRLDEHYRSQEPNHLFMELLNNQITTHCAAVTQATGQMALLAAMGVECPLPAEMGFEASPEDTVQ